MSPKTPLTVLFNASVILAGLKSQGGASGQCLHLVKEALIKGVISEVILDEVCRHGDKINLANKDIQRKVTAIFRVNDAPSIEDVDSYEGVVLDLGDAHVLASARKVKADYLITLDKKHLLSLKEKIKDFKIMSPAELLQILR